MRKTKDVTYNVLRCHGDDVLKAVTIRIPVDAWVGEGEYKQRAIVKAGYDLTEHDILNRHSRVGCKNNISPGASHGHERDREADRQGGSWQRGRARGWAMREAPALRRLGRGA